MRKILLLAVLLSAPAFSQVKVNALPAGGAISGPNLTICDQSNTTNSCTFTQVSSYVLGNLTGTTVYGLFGCAGVATTFLNGAGGCTTPTGGASLGTANTWTALQTFGTNISIGGVTVTGATGTGNNVFATSPTLVTPNLGTPSAITLTSGTGLPISTGVSGLGTGVAAFLATPSSANLATAVTGATGSGALVFGTSPTLTTPALGTPASGVATNLTGTAAALNIGGNAATATSATTAANLSGTPALPNGTTATTQTTGDNTTKIATDAFVLANAASAGVSSVASGGGGIVVTGTGSGPYTGAVTVAATAPNRTVTSSPTVASTDMGGQINSNVSGGGTLTIPAISSSVFPANSTLTVVNYSASTAAVSTTPTINSGGGCVSGTGIPAGDTWNIISNGTTLDCNQSISSASGGGNLSTSGSPAQYQVGVYASGTTLAGVAPSSTSGEAFVSNGSSANPGFSASLPGVTSVNGTTIPSSVTLTQTIASGTAAMGTSAISSATCATVVTVSASGVATTDTIIADFNGDPHAVTGYIPSTSGSLYIYKYPTSGNVNFLACNNTSSSVTPGAITLNWRVVR